MSLQLAAQHLSSQGRGKDSTLVHMSRDEVKGLNDLAMAHGGQLTINPQTGLPEAGFLESILPTIVGAGLMMIPGMQPMGAAAITGGLGYAMTGSLSKGLMAGLGAYGGANLGSGLFASGTDAAVAAAPEVAAAQQNAATQMQNFYDPATQAFKPGGLEAVQKASMDASTAQAAARTAAAPDFMSRLQAMGKGIGTLGQEGGFSNLYQNLGGSPMSLLKSVGSAAAPAINETMTPKKQEEEKVDADMGQRYGFSMNPTGGQLQQGQQAQPGQNPLSNTQTPTTTPFPQPDIYGREQRYFAPSYTKLTPEEAKKLYGYAVGGQVQMQGRVTMDEQGSGQFGQTGFGQQGANGYRAAGSGFAGNNNNAPQNQQGPFGGLDQRAIQANPQGLQFDSYNNQGPAQHSSYEDYLKSQSMFHALPQTREQFEASKNNLQLQRQQGMDMINRGNMSEIMAGLGRPQGSFGGGLRGGLGSLFGNNKETLFGGMNGVSNANAIGANTGYPMADINKGAYATPYQTPISRNVLNGVSDAQYRPERDDPRIAANQLNQQQFSSYAEGGVADEDRPTETPALQAFKQMQAQRAAQPPAPQIDANAEFDKYLQKTIGASELNKQPIYPPLRIDEGSGVDSYGQPYNSDNPRSPNADNYFLQPQTPASVVNSTSELIYDPIKKTYTQNPNFVDAESTDGAAEVQPGGPGYSIGRPGGNYYAGGGMSHLGDYSDGGRLLRGPGDGVSDSIPAMIGKKQPARLADGEFVVPARIVSELGNGSTEAGARKLYAMMDRIQKARGKTVGKGKVAKNSRSEKYLPA